MTLFYYYEIVITPNPLSPKTVRLHLPTFFWTLRKVLCLVTQLPYESPSLKMLVFWSSKGAHGSRCSLHGPQKLGMRV